MYGYVNRAIPDAELDREVEEIAARIARFDHDAVAATKAHVNRATLPSDDELASALPDFFGAFAKPGPQARSAKLASLGLNTDGDLERNLGRRVVEAAPDAL